MTKQELREEIRHRKGLYRPEELVAFSQDVVRRLESHPLFLSCSCVLLYYSLPDEVSTHALVQKWLGRKRILLPKVIGEAELELLELSDAPMKEGAFHIMEPQGDAFTCYEEIDLAVIPGMAFDSACHRLGRGRGYYDRLLRRLSDYDVPSVGLCFDFQKVDEVPVDVYDVSVSEVI